VEFFKEQLTKSTIAHADETGTKVNGVNRWIHSFSNNCKYQEFFGSFQS